MAQTLLLPINDMFVTAGYLTDGYTARFGFKHYGVDCYSVSGDHTIWASGVGKVLLTGWDNIVGNVVIVRYDNVWNHKKSMEENIVIRYLHLEEIYVKPGDPVTTATKLGLFGSTGKYVTGRHLHFELDTDLANITMTPTVGVNSNIIKKGYATTMYDPLDVMHIKTNAPDLQSLRFSTDTYHNMLYTYVETLPKVTGYVTTQPQQIEVGSTVRIKKGAESYEGVSMASFVYDRTYRVDELKENRAVLDLKGLATAFHVDDLMLA